jgi:VIT family
MLQETPESQAVELRELADIYKGRGLDADLAMQVACQLSAHDVVRAHARDELGIDIDDHPNPWQAAFASAVRRPKIIMCVLPAHKFSGRGCSKDLTMLKGVSPRACMLSDSVQAAIDL